MDNKIIEELNQRFFDEAHFVYVEDSYGYCTPALGLSLDEIKKIMKEFFEKKT